MKTTRVNRKVSAYAIHAHGRRFDGNYQRLFTSLAAMEKSGRMVKMSDLTIAISEIVAVDDGYFLTFVEGEEGVQPLILDLETGETHSEELEENEMLGSAAHAMISPGRRRILIEYVRGGAKADVMARTIEQLLVRSYGQDFRIDFSPIIKEDFIKEIDKFIRIRLASLTLIKPNAGWDDHYTKISQLLDESAGEKAQLSIKAARGESLNKNAGIVEVIKDVSNDEQPYLSDAEIRGIKEGDDVETSLPLHKHVLQRTVNVPRQADGSANKLRLRERMRELMGILF